MKPARMILIVEDEANSEQFLSPLLQKAGHDVTSATDGQEALQYLQTGAFDLMFLELILPDIRGMGLLTQVRNLYPDLPVLILAAYASLETAILAVRNGVRDYLIKPIDSSYIVARVEGILIEQRQPKRRREIMSNIQELLTELRQIDGQEIPLSGILSTFSSVDPTRFLQRGPLTIDLHNRNVMWEDHFISLSPRGFDYLVSLMRHSPNTVSIDTLVMESREIATSKNEARVLSRWRIRALRKALEPNPKQPRYIVTERGFGYRLVI